MNTKDWLHWTSHKVSKAAICQANSCGFIFTTTDAHNVVLMFKIWSYAKQNAKKKCSRAADFLMKCRSFQGLSVCSFRSVTQNLSGTSQWLLWQIWPHLPLALKSRRNCHQVVTSKRDLPPCCDVRDVVHMCQQGKGFHLHLKLNDPCYCNSISIIYICHAIISYREPAVTQC